MGIGIIGVLGGAAASPFKTGAEVFTASSDDFYEEVTQTINAGRYFVNWRAIGAPNGVVSGWLRDSAGRDYALKNGENIIYFPEQITGFTVATSFWRTEPVNGYLNPTQTATGSASANSYFYSPPTRKYNGMITRPTYYYDGSGKYGTAGSSDGLNWHRFTANGDGNANQFRGGPTMDNKGFISLRPRLNSTSRIYSTPDLQSYPGVYTTTGNGNNRKMQDYIDLSQGAVAGLTGYWVLVEGGELWYSSDCLTWTLHENLSAYGVGALVYENGKLFVTSSVASGTLIEIQSSTVGAVTTHSVGVSAGISHIGWDGTKYAVTPYDSLPYYSTDLTTWTQGSFDAGVGTTNPNINWSYIKWIPVSNEWIWCARYATYRSADGQTWELSPDPAHSADEKYIAHRGSFEGIDQGVQFSDSRMPDIQMTKSFTSAANLMEVPGLRQAGFNVTVLELLD